MNELKVFVERCVRPVKAEASKKLEMRRELYGHLESVYEQERHRTESDEAAAHAAIARMGDPKELTDQIDSSLSLLDRWVGAADLLTARDIGETPWQYAVRLSRFVSKATFVFLVPFFAVSVLVANAWGFHERFLLGFCVWLVVDATLGCLIFGWFFAMLRDQLEQHGWQKHLVPLFVKSVAALAFITAVGGWVFFYAVSGDAAAANAFYPTWILLGLLLGPGVLWAAWLDAKLTRDLREWQELQLDQ